MADPVQVVTPHLVVNDANAAIEFYKKALGATEALRMPAQDGKRLMHSEIHVNGARIFVMDDFPEHRGSHGWTRCFRLTRSRERPSPCISKSRIAMRRSSAPPMPAPPSRWRRGIRSGVRATPASWTRSAIPGALRTRCRRRAELARRGEPIRCRPGERRALPSWAPRQTPSATTNADGYGSPLSRGRR
jgi:hypothetical protein